MVIDSDNVNITKMIVNSFGSETIRFYYGQDLLGNEIGGLGHLGDYEATVFSKHSHNRRFGEVFVNKESFEKLAEGVATVKALLRLSTKYDVELPICQAVYSVISEGNDPKEQLIRLFMRPVKFEGI